VQSDEHLLTVFRYVERNALRAGLTGRAEDWRWGSMWRSLSFDHAPEPRPGRWPLDRPSDWTLRVNMPMTPAEEKVVQRSVRRGQPYGSALWQKRTASRLGLESTLRPRGRSPRKPDNGT
jgi:putative transposase